MNAMAAALLLGSLAATASAQEASAKGVKHEPTVDALIAQSAKGLNNYSMERERELGRWAAANLERALPIVHEPALDAYVAQIGATLAKNAKSAFTYTFTVYEDRRLGVEPRKADLTRSAGGGAAMPMDAFQGQAGEPVAVAGGPIFIPLSLLAAAPNEAVFAFQLAHAMAHIASRHVTKLATRDQLMGLDESRLQNTALRGQPPTAIPMGMLQFSQTFERQADYVALRIVSQAGYNPEAVMAYLSGQAAPEKSAGRLSAHPASSERAKLIRASFKSLPAGAYTTDTGGFAEAKAMAAGVR